MVRQKTRNRITAVIQAVGVFSPAPDPGQAAGDNVQQHPERRQPDQVEHRDQAPDAEGGEDREQQNDPDRDHVPEQRFAAPIKPLESVADQERQNHVNEQRGEFSGDIHLKST